MFVAVYTDPGGLTGSAEVSLQPSADGANEATDEDDNGRAAGVN